MSDALDDGLVAYVTVDRVVHGVRWHDVPTSNLVLMCTGQRAPRGTRTSANPEVITCLSCLVEALG